MEESIANSLTPKKTDVENLNTMTPEEIPAHFKLGKAHFIAHRYQDAIQEFESILQVSPGNIETRIQLRKAKEALVHQKVDEIGEEANLRHCLWMKLGLVSYRLCTHDYDCLTCEFDESVLSVNKSSILQLREIVELVADAI